MGPAAGAPSNWVRRSHSRKAEPRRQKTEVRSEKPHRRFGLLSPDLLICFALLACTFAVYFQTFQFNFVNYDDPEYVTANPHVKEGITPAGIAWAFTSTEAANWFPVTRLSEMLDCQLFGLNAGWHHLTNVFLHALATIVLFAFLRRATGAPWPSAFVAFVFALHPMHVESVAWISERKDVLSALFWFLALWAYIIYTERRTGRAYALLLAAFCLGLMSKPMIVTLPVLLLLMDIWPLRRTPTISEKLPLFALSAATAVATYFVQRQSGAVSALAAFPLGLRIENALVSYAVYMLKTVWPSGLAVFYPYPPHIPAWQPALALAVLAGITILAVRQWHSRPFLAIGWFWYLVTLAPVIGLVQVGAQARADRYTYVPMIGLLVMVAFLRLPGTAVRIAAVLACCAIVPTCWAQIGHWQNSVTLFQHALGVTRQNYIAEHNLGSALLDEPGRLPEAASHLEAAVRLDPRSVRALTDLGTAYAKLGRFPEAVAEYKAALAIDPDSELTRRNLESAKTDEADTYNRRGLDLAKDPAHFADAISQFEAALQLRPNDPEFHNNLGVILSQLPRRAPGAIAQFREAVRLKPDYSDAVYNLALALADSGRTSEAVAQLQASLRAHPDAQLEDLLKRLSHR